MIPKKKLSAEEVLQKLRHYCAYQERCHQEVREKGYALGLRKKELDAVLSQLIEENYLNEARFAMAFAGGKFRLRHWGRIKIRYALQQKGVSTYCIEQALAQFDQESYQKILEKLAASKWQSLDPQDHILSRKKRLYDYLMQKGYEYALVRQVSDQVIGDG